MYKLVAALLIVAAMTAGCEPSPVQWQHINWESADYGVKQRTIAAPTNDR